MINKSFISVRSSFGHDIPNVLYAQSSGSDSVVVLFPGTNYPCDKPLLYYARKIALSLGYDVLCLEYGYYKTNSGFNPKLAGDTIKESAEAVGLCLSRSYKNVYFISKSFGTLVAGDISKTIGYDKIKNLFLTPLLGTVSHISSSKCTVVVGTEDKFFFKEHINLISTFPSIDLNIIENANHSLESENSVITSLEILKNVTSLYVKFLSK
ncbi:hypothetical protein [Clostridium oryzae]|uniref:Alpha/beta hydrolase family protein n=1 Tax=Clostridium oryzae TaxID=1450648 RepID=A0A1V4IVV4_9CLOT|nr:hypothetical protein [Clostridium oryzae]OPJ63960.1 hypothetical protein CLORY_08320 [Clostridium oryzae]